MDGQMIAQFRCPRRIITAPTMNWADFPDFQTYFITGEK
jgi:hypothetical protein